VPEFESSNVRYKLYEAGQRTNLPSTKVQIVGTITIGFIVIVIWFLCQKLPERPPVVITRRRRYEDNRTWEYQGIENFLQKRKLITYSEVASVSFYIQQVEGSIPQGFEFFLKLCVEILRFIFYP
jgi:hypothetical protein